MNKHTDERTAAVDSTYSVVDGGSLRADLERLQLLVRRRNLLAWGAASGAALIVGCGDDSTTSDPSAGGSGANNTGGNGNCSKIPTEAAGPYPGDGTNGANALTLSGIVRTDIRSSLAGASGAAEGVPLTLELTVVDAANGCAPLAGHAVYAWHCDRAGNYSMYSAAVANENYLRGVQQTDASGKVTFQSIFPGCYSGRWPHVHFEIYETLDSANTGRNSVATSQLALPQNRCQEAYAAAGYEASIPNLANISLSSDNVFSDGTSLQLAEVEGSVSAGYVARLTIAI
jgi:protocatechuate 3,4-dioxygenase beta subunit